VRATGIRYSPNPRNPRLLPTRPTPKVSMRFGDMQCGQMGQLPGDPDGVSPRRPAERIALRRLIRYYATTRWTLG
jgi:hypothetical protein